VVAILSHQVGAIRPVVLHDEVAAYPLLRD
jgi:hypothetical protein